MSRNRSRRQILSHLLLLAFALLLMICLGCHKDPKPGQFPPPQQGGNPEPETTPCLDKLEEARLDKECRVLISDWLHNCTWENGECECMETVHVYGCEPFDYIWVNCFQCPGEWFEDARDNNRDAEADRLIVIFKELGHISHM